LVPFKDLTQQLRDQRDRDPVQRRAVHDLVVVLLKLAVLYLTDK